MLRLYECSELETTVPPPDIHCNFKVSNWSIQTNQTHVCDTRRFGIYANEDTCGTIRGFNLEHCDFEATCLCFEEEFKLKFYETPSLNCKQNKVLVQYIKANDECQEIGICGDHKYYANFTEHHWVACCGWKCGP